MADANPTLDVQVVSPERVLYEGQAEMLVCRTSDGEIAFLPGHVPFLGALGVAKVRALLPGGGEQAVAVHGGFVEVSHDRVIVLSDVAELPEQIDVGRAQAARTRAEAELTANEEDEEAAAALARAELRLDVAGAATP
ncbi:MAG TPA: ATP synthase F1 subunit epsilon [Acidimicrobiia bacterium]|nr:ATP synthase F1 subunit epsilon [Acidimicrobiia bacterium]